MITWGAKRRCLPLAAAPACDIVSQLGEGPRWDPEQDALVWLDVPRRLMHRMKRDGAVTTVSLNAWVSAIALCVTRIRYVAATELGFGFVSPLTGRVEAITNVEEGGRARMNDGGVDGAGRFFAGSVSAIPEQGNGSLHCLRPDGSVERVVGDVRLSNGMGWSGDRRNMYYVDTPRRSLDHFDYDMATGALSRRRSFIAFRETEGLPDGLCIDAEDRIWVALWGSGAVHCYAPTGELVQVVQAPCKNVTACTFWGPNDDTLYITSAATGDEGSPSAGKLFACRVGAKGGAVARFDDRRWPMGEMAR